MSWLARSIANSLLSPDSPEADGEDPRASGSTCPGSPPRGVREDLSELTDALAHRFQGLASFLAAPTPAGSGGAPRGLNPSEIAGRFRLGLARLPGRQAVADLAKNASSLLHPDEYWGWSEAAGATEDVIAFARDAAMRPELWLDFPLLPDDADSDGSADFDISDAGAVPSDKISSGVPVQLMPVLRDATKFSQSRMEETIHTPSKEHATEFSQPSIEERTPDSITDDAVANEQCVPFVDSAPSEEDQHKWPLSDLSEQSRVVIQKAHNDDSDDDEDEWLEEDTGGPGSTHIPIVGDDEDISFSDLEEDD
ncbi:unnamed protein product [Triticum turgidum subsp. durum]|uniref:BSD domain-containing protein n=1 Tax=Triticum turgidum subsp. durum TaxID=4567 RepID=A0A9R0SY50_TRITD|nr:unnamed protein product [Triticum turgidum subsp. durum]